MTQELKVMLSVADGKAEVDDVTLDDQPISETERTPFMVQLVQDGSLKLVIIDLDEIDEVSQLPKHFPLQIEDASYQSIEDVEAYLDERFDDPDVQPTPFKWQPFDNLFVRTQLQRQKVPGPVRIAASSAAAADMQLLDSIELVSDDGEPVILLDDRGHKLPLKVVDVLNDKMYGSVPAFEIGLSHDQYPVEFPAGSLSNFGIMWQYANDGSRQQRCWRGCYGRDLHKSPQQLVIRVEP